MYKRLPKAKEVEELLENCIWTLEGNGHRVTGPSGNSIFLPMDGAIMEDEIGEVSEGGCYWALDTEGSEPGYASNYYFSEDPASRDFGSWNITDKLSVRMVGDSGIDLGLSVRWMPYNEEINLNKLFTHSEALKINNEQI